MDNVLLIKFFFAFAFVISLMLLFSWFLKKIGLSGHVAAGVRSKRRLSVVEFLPLDHKRKLVLIRRDNQEHLIILGATGETLVEGGIPVTENVVAIVKEQKIVQG